MIGTCWSSSLLTSLINSAFSPVSLVLRRPRFPGCDQGQGGYHHRGDAAARVRNERRDLETTEAGPWSLSVSLLFIMLSPRYFVASDEHQPEPADEGAMPSMIVGSYAHLVSCGRKSENQPLMDGGYTHHGLAATRHQPLSDVRPRSGYRLFPGRRRGTRARSRSHRSNESVFAGSIAAKLSASVALFGY